MNTGRFILEPVSGPDIEPVTLAEMRRHLRCFASDTTEDADITALIVVGREWLERYTGRALVDQTWRLTIEQRCPWIPGEMILRPHYYGGRFAWFGRFGEIALRKAPVLAITSLATVAADGVETTVDSSAYALREADSKWPRLVPLSGATWTTADLLRITFRAGFADRTGSPVQDASVVPERFKQAIKLYGEAHYDRDQVMMEKLIAAATNMVKSERSELGIA